MAVPVLGGPHSSGDVSLNSSAAPSGSSRGPSSGLRSESPLESLDSPDFPGSGPSDVVLGVAFYFPCRVEDVLASVVLS